MTRFRNPGQLCSWAGLTPRHRESDVKVARGHMTKQGSRLLRWAVIEAIQRTPADSVTGSVKEAIIARRGKEARNIAKVAGAAAPDPGLLRDARRPHPLPGHNPRRRAAAGACGMNSKQLSWPAARREVARFSAPPPPAARALS